MESLRDGRGVYIYSEQVEDVTTHLAFRNAAASGAQLYDALHDAKTKDVLTATTDTGSGGHTTSSFRRPTPARRLSRSATEFGARHELYEMNYSGSHELVRLFPLQQAQASGLGEMEALVERCMADYDEDDWLHPAYHDGSDISLVAKK